MKHIKQGEDECFPTTLAMLSGVDVNKILAETKVMSPRKLSWSSFTRNDNPDDITNVFKALARKYAPYLMNYCEPVSTFKISQAKRFIGYDKFIMQTVNGKGAVLSVSRYLSRPLAHISAFEAGIVFDSCAEGPMSSKDYYIHLAKTTVLCPYAVVKENQHGIESGIFELRKEDFV